MSQLAYIEPQNFRKLAGATHSDWRMPEDLDAHGEGRWFRLCGLSKLEAMRDRSKQFVQKRYVSATPFDRSVAAWYLNASGFKFNEISELFEISAATVSGSVRGIRNQAYQIRNPALDKKVKLVQEKELFLTVNKETQLAHIVTQSYREMRDVEYIMGYLRGDYATHSAALKLGERKFKSRRHAVGDYRCVCNDCKQTTLPEMAIN